MEFGVLGVVRALRVDGSVVAVGGPQVRALLALLSLDAGRVVTTRRLIDGLYGHHPPADAAHALQSQVSRLRRGLGDAGLVEFDQAGYRLAVDPDEVDAHRFSRLAATGRVALAAGEASRAADKFAEALGLWRGPALADVLDAPFAEAQAARLTEAQLAVAENHAEALLAQGDHRVAATTLRELVSEHPLRERARALMMRALSAAGRQAEALTEFEDIRRLLADELGADPSAELAEAHLATLRGELTTRVIRVPAPFTSFIGRQKELTKVDALLATSRLVTLTGPGGVGKTRIAVEAGVRAASEVCFADLSLLSEGCEVPQAVAAALGLRESGFFPSAAAPPGTEERLLAALADRRLLLILDNCEHVLQDAARLAHLLLAACPGLRLLATSREALGIMGESLCPLSPLNPAPAVLLFADRASAVRPDFAVDDTNHAMVRRICTALDGLPLAIELAAARLRSLTLEQVADRLDDRFGLLTRGNRTAATRHRTLRAAVAWSWDLLGADEQLLARRLTVFPAGAGLDEVQRVCALPEVDGLLADLVDKSLVEVVDGRYRMLETIREFGAQRLAEAGEREQRLRAHAECFLDLAQTADPRLRGADQVIWLARLSAEHSNLHAALRWAVEADQRLALSLIGALSWFWWLRGLRGDAAPLAAQLLSALDAEPPAGLAEEYLLCLVTATAHGSPGPALQARLAAMGPILAGLTGPLRRPYLLFLWAMTAKPITGDPTALIGPDPWSTAFAEVGTGLQAMYLGEPAEAERAFDAAVAGFRRVGDRWGIANTLEKLAILADWRGRSASFLAMMDEAIDLIGQLGAVEDTVDLLSRRADGLARQGHLDTARTGYRQAIQIARRAGAQTSLAGAQSGLGEIARWSGEVTEARCLHELALGRCEAGSAGADEKRARIHVALGRVAEAEGLAEEATAHHREALAIALRNQNFPCAASATEGLAGLALLAGNGERAAVLLGTGVALRGLALATDPDVARTDAGARAMIGDAAHAAARERGAAQSREEALTMAADNW
jgi:predicted ATPase/DNA-binding SARP family transcriptional activator